MTCVWRRRPASRVVLSGIVAVLWAASLAAAAPAPVLRFVPGTAATAQEKDWLANDARWVAGLPPAVRDLDAGAGGLPADPEARGAWLAALRSALGRAAAAAPADSGLGIRPAAALLRDRWLQRGYLVATVQRRGGRPAEDGRIRPDTLLVAPGGPWSIGRLQVDGEDFPGRRHLLETWLPRSGDRFAADLFNESVDRILAGAGEAGRPVARWVTRSMQLDADEQLVDIEAALLAGDAAWLGPITTSLAGVRESAFAVRSSGLESGAPFRQSDIVRAVDRLLARDLYARVDEPVVHLTSAGDTVGVHLPIVPRRKVNRMQVVLGLSRREEGGSRLSGQVDLDLPNMAGTGRALAVGWRDDGDRARRFGFRYLEPLAFGTPLDTDLALDNEVFEEAYTRFRVDNRWRLPVVALWGVEVGLGWDRVTYPAGAIERTSRTRVRGAVLHRRGDRSRSGWEGSFAVEEAWRTSTARPDTAGGGSAAPPALGEATTQRIFEVDAAGELWLSGSISLFGRTSLRELTGATGVVPLSEQFRFGGAATLRGWREDELHGSRAAWSAVEMRIGAARGSRLYLFHDLGYFAFEAEDPTPDDPDRLIRQQGWPRGYGLGILARTPGGDLSLAVGFPGTPDFDLAKLHVTLMESF